MNKINIIFTLFTLLIASRINAPVDAHVRTLHGEPQTISRDTREELIAAIRDGLDNEHAFLPDMFPSPHIVSQGFFYGSERLTAENVEDVLAHAPDPIEITAVKKRIQFAKVNPIMGDRKFVSTIDPGLALRGSFNIGKRDAIEEILLMETMYFITVHAGEDHYNTGALVTLKVETEHKMDQGMQDALLEYFYTNSRAIRAAFTEMLETERDTATKLLFTYAVGKHDEMQPMLNSLDTKTLNILRQAGLIPELEHQG